MRPGTLKEAVKCVSLGHLLLGTVPGILNTLKGVFNIPGETPLETYEVYLQVDINWRHLSVRDRDMCPLFLSAL